MSGINPENNQSEEEEKRKLPEFVFVDSEQTEDGHEFAGFEQEFKQSYKQMEGGTYPIGVRIACLVCAFFLSLALLIASPFLITFFLLNLVTFFQLPDFWKRTRRSWSTFKKLFVTTLGLVIGIFSPAFGLSVIMVYFMMRGQQMDEYWVTRILQARFRNH